MRGKIGRQAKIINEVPMIITSLVKMCFQNMKND